MPTTESASRLCLVTPPDIDPGGFPAILDDALAGGDVASLIITAEAPLLPALAKALVPVAQAHEVAALIHNDTRIAGHVRADGVHVDSGRTDLAAALASLRPRGIVGAGNVTTRHDAMLIGEMEPDYIFFGQLDGDDGEAIFPKAFALAEWWATLFEIPAVVMGGASIASLEAARDAGIEFVALRQAVWEHPAGPRAAVGEANRLLARATEKAS